MSEVQEDLVFTLRKKVFSLISSKFQIFNEQGELIGFCKQKAFKLKEDIRIYSDTTMQKELMCIKARAIIDFSAAYDVLNSSTGESVGALQRRGMKSMLRDEWVVLDPDNQPFGTMKEEGSLAVLRRFVPFVNLIPQEYDMRDNAGSILAKLNTHFNPFVHKLTVRIPAGCPLHPMLIVSAGVLLLAIEGRKN